MIRIRIETTIRPMVHKIDLEPALVAPAAVPAAPAGSMPSIPKLLPCVICGRAPQQMGHWCFICSVMPKYLMISLGHETFPVAQGKVHAWQDAAPNN